MDGEKVDVRRGSGSHGRKEMGNVLVWCDVNVRRLFEKGIRDYELLVLLKVSSAFRTPGVQAI